MEANCYSGVEGECIKGHAPQEKVCFFKTSRIYNKAKSYCGEEGEGHSLHTLPTALSTSYFDGKFLCKTYIIFIEKQWAISSALRGGEVILERRYKN